MTFQAWCKDTGIRALKTAAQSAVALLGADQANWLDADLKTVGLTAVFAGVVAILHNIANLKTAQEG